MNTFNMNKIFFSVLLIIQSLISSKVIANDNNDDISFQDIIQMTKAEMESRKAFLQTMNENAENNRRLFLNGIEEDLLAERKDLLNKKKEYDEQNTKMYARINQYNAENRVLFDSLTEQQLKQHLNYVKAQQESLKPLPNTPETIYTTEMATYREKATYIPDQSMQYHLVYIHKLLNFSATLKFLINQYKYVLDKQPGVNVCELMQETAKSRLAAYFKIKEEAGKSTFTFPSRSFLSDFPNFKNSIERNLVPHPFSENSFKDEFKNIEASLKKSFPVIVFDNNFKKECLTRLENFNNALVKLEDYPIIKKAMDDFDDLNNK